VAVIARLLLAHFIADFPLQFDFLFKLKKKSYWGCFLHAVIHASVTVLFFLGCLREPSFWFYIAFLLIVHSFQDWGKIKLWVRPEDDKISYFILDQFLHYAFAFIAMLFPFAGSTAYYGNIIPADWWFYYNNAGFLNIISAAVLAGWGGVVLLFYLDKSVYKIEIEALSRFERSYGVIERILVVIFIIRGGFFYLLIPMLFLLRFSGLRRQPLYRGILSLVFASCIGFLAYFINGISGL